MQYVIRNWTCRNCGRSNKTEVALDGTVQCGFCTDSMKIQPGRSRVEKQSPGQSARLTEQAP